MRSHVGAVEVEVRLSDEIMPRGKSCSTAGETGRTGV